MMKLVDWLLTGFDLMKAVSVMAVGAVGQSEELVGATQIKAAPPPVLVVLTLHVIIHHAACIGPQLVVCSHVHINDCA